MGSVYGAFGKMPGAGDFIRFGLPGDFVSAWDAWLQAGMIEAARHLGSMWDDAYFSAPIWRFGLPRGAAGRAAMLGVVMPSVDRVGRRFPLTLALSLPNGASLVGSFLQARAVFVGLEDAALAALDAATAPADLERDLSAMTAPLTASAAESRLGELVVLHRDADADSAADLATALIGAAADGKSLWCTQTDAGSVAFAAEALPSPQVFARLMHPFADREPV